MFVWAACFFLLGVRGVQWWWICVYHHIEFSLQGGAFKTVHVCPMSHYVWLAFGSQGLGIPQTDFCGHRSPCWDQPFLGLPSVPLCLVWILVLQNLFLLENNSYKTCRLMVFENLPRCTIVAITCFWNMLNLEKQSWQNIATPFLGPNHICQGIHTHPVCRPPDLHAPENHAKVGTCDCNTTVVNPRK